MRNWNLPNRTQLHKLHRTPDHIQIDIFPSLLTPQHPIHPEPQQLDTDFERLKEAEAYNRETYPAVQQNNSNLALFLWLCILLDFIMDNSVSSTKGLVLAKVAPAIWPCDACTQPPCPCPPPPAATLKLAAARKDFVSTWAGHKMWGMPPHGWFVRSWHPGWLCNIPTSNRVSCQTLFARVRHACFQNTSFCNLKRMYGFAAAYRS